MTTPLVQLYLDRSKAPLMLRCHSESKDPSAHSAAIRGPCTQIRLLSFEMMSWSRWKATSERFSASSLPTLLDLHIPATTNVDPTAPDFALFPPAFNLGHLPIQVYGPSPIWSYIAFPDLTGIRVGLDAKQRPIVLLGKLFYVVRSSPLLEDVHLEFGIPALEPGVSHHPVSLPRL